MKKMFSKNDLIIIKSYDTLTDNQLEEIKGGINDTTLKKRDCVCKDSNTNIEGGNCTCESGNQNGY
ncbi:MAG: hypothetical protein LBT56_01460 [Prevotellaceae bacterium]|jgi:hypothetical protein|nr:hypothetical protein [Prevotellaceae bacterium]